MNIITRLITSIFGITFDASDEAHGHFEALQGDSALIRLVRELRDLETELGQTETSTG